MITGKVSFLYRTIFTFHSGDCREQILSQDVSSEALNSNFNLPANGALGQNYCQQHEKNKMLKIPRGMEDQRFYLRTQQFA